MLRSPDIRPIEANVPRTVTTRVDRGYPQCANRGPGCGIARELCCGGSAGAAGAVPGVQLAEATNSSAAAVNRVALPPTASALAEFAFPLAARTATPSAINAKRNSAKAR